MNKTIILFLFITLIGCDLKSVDKNYDPESKLKELGVKLSNPSNPVANYVNVVRSGNLLFLSGKGPLKDDGNYIKGKVGTDLTIEQGYDAARLTGINQ